MDALGPSRASHTMHRAHIGKLFQIANRDATTNPTMRGVALATDWDQDETVFIIRKNDHHQGIAECTRSNVTANLSIRFSQEQ